MCNNSSNLKFNLTELSYILQSHACIFKTVKTEFHPYYIKKLLAM